MIITTGLFFLLFFFLTFVCLLKRGSVSSVTVPLSFCLSVCLRPRAEEVDAIMASLEKANQVSTVFLCSPSD